MVLVEGLDTRPLRYGDEVMLSEKASLAVLRGSTGLGTYLYADELAADVPQRGAASIPGMHECAFRLCAHQAYRAQDELDKALAVDNLGQGWRAKLGPAHPRYSGISVLAHEAEKEAQANTHRSSTTRGRVIAYGERVQLQHAWSGAIVTAIREPSEQDPQGILIQLVQQMDEGAWFTVLSPGKALQHGDCVRNNAAIVLENARYPGRYLALNTATASLDATIDIEASLLPHSYIRRRLECFLGFHQQSFAACIFRREAVNASLLPPRPGTGQSAARLALAAQGAYVAAGIAERRITGTDIVQLYHREDDAMLVVEVPTRGADLTDHQKPAERGVAFFMPLQGQQQDPGAKSLFLVQHSTVELGGEQVLSRDNILLQHLVTGLYLCWEGDGSQLSATYDYAGRVRANGGRVEPPPDLMNSAQPHQAGGYDPDVEPPRSPLSPSHRSPLLSSARAEAALGNAQYSGAANPCEMSLMHVNTTSGAVVPVSTGGPVAFSSLVYLSHSAGRDDLNDRVFLRKMSRVSKIGAKELCKAVSTRTPAMSECLLELRRSDMVAARSVLDITGAVNVVNGLVANIARSEQLQLPLDRNGDVDMNVRNEYVMQHPTSSLIVNSVVLLDHLVNNLITRCEAQDAAVQDPDGEGEGDIGKEELGRADFRGGVGGARGVGSVGTHIGAGWGDERLNSGKGTKMQHLLRQHGGTCVCLCVCVCVSVCLSVCLFFCLTVSVCLCVCACVCVCVLFVCVCCLCLCLCLCLCVCVCIFE